MVSIEQEDALQLCTRILWSNIPGLVLFQTAAQHSVAVYRPVLSSEF